MLCVFVRFQTKTRFLCNDAVLAKAELMLCDAIKLVATQPQLHCDVSLSPLNHLRPDLLMSVQAGVSQPHHSRLSISRPRSTAASHLRRAK